MGAERDPVTCGVWGHIACEAAETMTAAGIPPKYNLALVAQVILEEAARLHPQHLTVRELSLRIIADPDDSREVETATEAIRDLRQSGLFSYRDDDEVVEPTRAALRAFALLAR